MLLTRAAQCLLHPMSEARCIFFDLGQVLFYLRVEAFWDALSGGLPDNQDAIVARYTASGLQTEYETGRLSCDEFFPRLQALLGTDHSREELEYAWGTVLAPDEENLKLAAQLRKQYRTAVISNTNAAHIRTVAPMWESYDPFDKCFYSHEVGCMKPDAAIFELAIREMGFEPDECVFFDDREENVEAAEDCGMRAYQVLEPKGLKAGVQRAGMAMPRA